MEPEPLWTRCLHLSAGTCPQINLDSHFLWAEPSPRPELSQDLALAKLAQACQTCPLAPRGPGQEPA